MAACGADGVMVGRAAYGQPDLAGRIDAELAGEDAARSAYDMAAHYRDIIDFYGEGLGLRCARKHLGWWLDRLPVAPAASRRLALMTSRDVDFVLAGIRAIDAEARQNGAVSGEERAIGRAA